MNAALRFRCVDAARHGGFTGGVKPVLQALLAIALGCFFSPTTSAQVVNRPPVPEWISTAESRAGQPLHFRKHFRGSPALLKSVVLGACEGRMELFLNGQRVGEITGATNATGFDVTTSLLADNNVLAVRAVNSTGPVKLAVLLELNGDLAKQTWIPSSTDWLVQTREEPDWTQVKFPTAGWQPARSLGRVDADAKANPFAPDKMVDAYNSWKLARAGTAATDPATFTLLPGFKAELVRSALPEEGSWIALAFDPQGRLTLAREKKGLLRLMLDSAGVSKVEVINDTLLECRGLLYAHGALYANANNSKTLVRLRDTKGTGQFDETTELLKTEGGVGHGRNHLKLGPDGWLWIAHGNNVHLPKNLSTNSPLRNFAHDRLIPCPWDAGMFDGDVNLPAGHILRMKPDGSEVQLWAGGLRNPLDIAFNEHGDLFTFDADMEWDVGCPWYVPNRVLHIVPGADYGWRRGTGRWPAWYPDTLPSVVDIGLASPTAVTFGRGAKFPAKYQKAFYICDWAYGRILAVHLTPQGASYTGTSELFVGGRPLNVTDVCIGPDGAMWFTTGGRGTQSGLYRVSYVKHSETKPVVATQELNTETARWLRRRYEERQGAYYFPHWHTDKTKLTSDSPEPLERPDVYLRQAVRQLLERTGPERWKNDAIKEIRPDVSLQAWLALVRISKAEPLLKARLIERLVSLRLSDMDDAPPAFNPHQWPKLPEERQILALRAVALTFIRLGSPDETQRQATLNWLEPLYPNASPRVNQMLVELLVYLRSPQVIAKTVPLLRAATASEDLLLYPFYLRYARDGWTPDARRAVFAALDRAERLPGGRTYFTSIANVRKELLASLTPEERTALGTATAGSVSTRKAGETPALPPPRFVKDWKLADLEPRLSEVGKGRSHEGARTALLTAQCVHCHRVSHDPAFPNSVIGPELLAVGARFSRRDLLLHIIEPSAVIDEKFRQTRLLLKDGDDVSGMVEREADNKLFVRPSPLEEKLIEVAATNVRERRLSEVSPMPGGLLNGLRLEQILDLLAYLEAAGDPKHRNFQP
ncbi:MAG: Glucose/sorbosone dehydrogenase [Limisphaerales bacterium]|nr:MAG: Glucose/sorbosone dehydrogenase [Limisphaerales bacterium]KAG0508861.1 MAG: Glucose/sorbosone dehydrogenase [Limisphaerales bacterium]TXT50202.1 MAG: Glucose/sorbosone dehydrogenase [Limisphaerales bacterium]